MPETRKISLMDTTLRDGEQTQGVSFSPEEKVNLAKALLGKLKVDRLEVASARVSEGEKQAVASIVEWAKSEGLGRCVEVLGFVDGQKSVDWVKDTGASVINLLTKGSEKHCRGQLGKSLEQHVADIRNTVAYAKEQGMSVNVYFEDWSNGYRDSREYVYELAESLRTEAIGHVMLPDTLGVMSPTEVYDSLSDMVKRFPTLQFDFHPHNDYGLATANAMSAVAAGVNTIHCTMNCLGERAGNASLAEVVVVLRDKMAMQLSIDESHIVSVSQMVESFSGKFVAGNAPVLGSDVFTQTAGIHADGDHKGDLYVSRLQPERFARKRTYALGKMAGKASLLKNLDELGITLSEENQKRVLDRVVKLGDSKQKITLDDLPFIIADVLESGDYQHIQLRECVIRSQLNGSSIAEVDIEIDGEVYQERGEGNGGFDAFTNAIRQILSQRDIELPKLIDYQVHIPKGGHTNALTEAIVTWQLENGAKTTTRGVHSNQVYAAIEATLRIVNRALHHNRAD